MVEFSVNPQRFDVADALLKAVKGVFIVRLVLLNNIPQHTTILGGFDNARPVEISLADRSETLLTFRCHNHILEMQ